MCATQAGFDDWCGRRHCSPVNAIFPLHASAGMFCLGEDDGVCAGDAFDNRCAVAGIVGVVGLAAAAVIDLSKYNIMLQILLVGASAFCLFSWIAKKISFLNIVKKLSGICAKYCFPFFLTHHYLLEWLTQRFTGYTLRRSEVYLLCLACFAVSWVVSYYLDRVTKAVLVFFKTVKN